VEAVEELMLETEEAQATANVRIVIAVLLLLLVAVCLTMRVGFPLFPLRTTGNQQDHRRQLDRRGRGRRAQRARRDRAAGGGRARSSHARGSSRCDRTRCVRKRHVIPSVSSADIAPCQHFFFSLDSGRFGGRSHISNNCSSRSQCQVQGRQDQERGRGNFRLAIVDDLVEGN
jgi:hypothetical protein